MEFIQKVIRISDIEMSYRDTLNLNAKKTILLLAPGAFDSSYFSNLIELCDSKETDYRFISPDYPGRGGSYELNQFDTVELIAKYVFEFIKALNLKDLVIVGESFGTAVTTELIKIAPRDLSTKIILVAPGEYIDKRIKPFLDILFYPGLVSSTFREVFRKILLKLPIGIKTLPERKLKSIDEQFISIYNYRIQFAEPTDIPATLIVLKRDKIVRKGSIKKVKAFYQTHKSIILNLPHDFTPEKVDKINTLILQEIDS